MGKSFIVYLGSSVKADLITTRIYMCVLKLYTIEYCVFNACGINGWINQIKKDLDE